MIARIDEMPQMLTYASDSATYGANDIGVPIATSVANPIGQITQLTNAQSVEWFPPPELHDPRLIARANFHLAHQEKAPPPMGPKVMTSPPLRRVQVFIADTDTNVPLADRILYESQPFTTDLTDQELFYDIEIKTILEAHNAKRTKLYDKAVKTRSQMLEPLRIRDLKMTVVTIAQF